MTTEQLAQASGADRGERHIGARDPRLETWRGFLQAHARLFRRLDEELRAEHAISLPEYDALLQLAQAPGRRLRMSQLADQVLLSKSGITRMVDRLVADGLVERSQCSTDARGAEAVLTDEGLERFRLAARTHLDGVDRYFLTAVEGPDLAVIQRAMASINRRTGDTGVESAASDRHEDGRPAGTDDD
jgi:DNA-binding MarR family transcriptional regulator